jgi:hypothetical protein
MMISRSSWIVLLICLALLVFATPVLAGGWATVTLDEIPGEVRAGETVQLSFVVKQHGKTPVHFLTYNMDNMPLEPFLKATNLNTGETIRVAAERGKEVGHFTLAAVFPSEGEWEWDIVPDPLGGATEFEPLTVLPATTKVDKSTTNTPPAASNTFVSQRTFQVASAILIAVALATIAIALFARRRKMAAQTGR